MIREIAWSNAFIGVFLFAYMIGAMGGLAGADPEVAWNETADAPEGAGGTELEEMLLDATVGALRMGMAFGYGARHMVNPWAAAHLIPIAMLVMVLPMARK